MAKISWPWNITVHTVFDIYYRIYSIPNHDKNQWPLLQFIVLLMMEAKARPKHVELLTPNKKNIKKCISLAFI